MNNNLQTCRNCKHENPLFSLTCNNCNAYLRSKISNLDFWDITWKLFYEPTNTFIKIIQAEKKNYLILISFLFLIRFSVFNFIIKNYESYFFDLPSAKSKYSFFNGLLILSITFLFSILIYFLSKKMNIKTRLKDNYSILIFSFVPNILMFLFFIPFQLALFGLYWFTINPLPTIIKPTASYVFYSFEVIFFIWSFILIFIAIKTQLSKTYISFLITVFYFLITSFTILI